MYFSLPYRNQVIKMRSLGDIIHTTNLPFVNNPYFSIPSYCYKWKTKRGNKALRQVVVVMVVIVVIVVIVVVVVGKEK